MTTISGTIIADSISPEGIRLTTMHLRYPRFIHAELMTHRVFSRNARSSRAVPVATMLKEIETDPVVPLFWGANQKGMQADRECDELVLITDFKDKNWPKYDGWTAGREEAWLAARDHAVHIARAFSEAGYHKQVVNRLLEPFMHIDTLVTATSWANWHALRDHKDAEPHIAMLARATKAAMDESMPALLQPGEWHLPYVSKLKDFCGHGSLDLHVARAVSVARCARISYKPFDGNGSIEAEIARHDALVGSQPMHASPAEHQATPDTRFSVAMGLLDWKNYEEHGNFYGWRQYRKMIAGEAVMEGH